MVTKTKMFLFSEGVVAKSFYTIGYVYIWSFIALIQQRNPFPCVPRFQIGSRSFRRDSRSL